MNSRWRSWVDGGRAAVLIALILLAGCTRQTQGGSVQPEPPRPQPETITPAPPPLPPPPSQEDLAYEAACKAANDGDPGRAVTLYESAASLATDGDRLAEIYFALGLLHSDPNNLTRDVARGRGELQRVLDGRSDHPRVRDARVVTALLDEISQLRTQSSELHDENEEMRGRLAALTERLDQKEKELAEIKKILLQDKKKP